MEGAANGFILSQGSDPRWTLLPPAYTRRSEEYIPLWWHHGLEGPLLEEPGLLRIRARAAVGFQPQRSGRTRNSFPLRGPLLPSVVRQSIEQVSGNGFILWLCTIPLSCTTLHPPHASTHARPTPICGAHMVMLLWQLSWLKNICSRLSSKRRNSMLSCLYSRQKSTRKVSFAGVCVVLMRLAGAQMSDRRSCLQRDEEKKKTAKKIKICSHQVFFSLRKKTHPLLICLRYEPLPSEERFDASSWHPTSFCACW